MRKATRLVAASCGMLAGLAGLEHGCFEILQGNGKLENMLFFASMGPPCVPEKIWNACEPAMSIVPNFLVTGILTVLLGLVITAGSAAFISHKHAGWILIGLSIALLLVGGGFFPPLIGIVGGAAATQIHKAVRPQPGSLTRFAAKLWPWPLVVFGLWLLGQFPVGYFFNGFLMGIMGFGVLLILTSLALSVYSSYAHDAAA